MNKRKIIGSLILFFIIIIIFVIGLKIKVPHYVKIISEPPIENAKVIIEPPFIVEPAAIKHVKVTFVAHANSGVEAQERPYNYEKPPAKDIYEVIFKLDTPIVIASGTIWVKNLYVIDLEEDTKYPYNDFLKDPKHPERRFWGSHLSMDRNYFRPPIDFEGEGLLEIIIHNRTQYFIIKKFKQLIPQ